eukprot:555066_1
MAHHETIMPLIKIYRKLSSCNQSQVKQLIQQFPQIFIKHNSLDVLTTILLTGICKHHSQISSDLFKEIESLLPHEKSLKINDSITKSDIQKDETDEKDDKNNIEPLTLIKIPKDLKIYMCNFLQHPDLIPLQKTCRCLNISARDPNSLYFTTNFEWRPPYHSKFWSKVPIGFVNGKIKGKGLKILKLVDFQISNELIDAIIRCVNLETLEMRLMKFENESMIENINNRNIFQNAKLNPLKKLNCFVMGISMHCLSNFAHWILSSNTPKTIRFLRCGSDQLLNIEQKSLLFSNSQIALLALQSIKNIEISG